MPEPGRLDLLTEYLLLIHHPEKGRPHRGGPAEPGSLAWVSVLDEILHGAVVVAETGLVLVAVPGRPPTPARQAAVTTVLTQKRGWLKSEIDKVRGLRLQMMGDLVAAGVVQPVEGRDDRFRPTNPAYVGWLQERMRDVLDERATVGWETLLLASIASQQGLPGALKGRDVYRAVRRLRGAMGAAGPFGAALTHGLAGVESYYGADG